MRKYFITISLVLLSVITLFAFTRRSSSKADSPELPSSTPTISESPTPTVTPTATTTLLATPKPLSCSDAYTGAKQQANDFMKLHQSRRAADVLQALSAPLATEDSLQLDYLQGNDTGDGMRLYELTQFNYTTKSYALGTLVSNGADPDDRGALRCQLLVHETRTNEINGSFTENTVTRYLEFTLYENKSLVLVAFKEGKNGAKYSGFN